VFQPRPGYRKTNGAVTNARSLSCAAKGEPKAKKEKAKNKEDKKKKAPTQYNCFVKAELGKVKDENPALSNKEAFKVVAAKWSAKTADQKAQYVSA
jgi:hypothetical protein